MRESSFSRDNEEVLRSQMVNQKQKNEIITLKQENSTLQKKVEKMNESIQRLSYRDVLESKLNTTFEDKLNNDIRELEDKLRKLEADKLNLTIELNKRQDNFDSSIMKVSVEGESRMLQAEERNAKLVQELINSKKKIKSLEKELEDKTNMLYTRPDPLNNLSNISQLFPDDGNQNTSFLNGSLRFGETSTLYTNKDKASSLEKELYRLKGELEEKASENSELLHQLQEYRKELKHKEDNTVEMLVIDKLRNENKDLLKRVADLSYRNTKLNEENSSLTSKLSSVNLSSSVDSELVENLKYKVRTLEETNINLLKEIRTQKRSSAEVEILKSEIASLNSVSRHLSLEIDSIPGASTISVS